MTEDAQQAVDILIPARNEADRLPATIRALRASVPGRILVVDDGSTDGTAAAAREAGADVVFVHETNQGKGAALNTALELSSSALLLLADADLADTARELAPLVAAVRSGASDMAIAAFPSDGRKSGVGLAQGLARWGLRLRTGHTFSSPLSGQRCMRREIVERAGGFAEGFGVEVALTLAALAQGARVEEVPLPLSHRKTGRDMAGWRHRARQAAAVVRALNRRYSPDDTAT